MSSYPESRPTILFLYTELAGYVFSCLQELSKHAEVHVVHWPVNKEAPFQFPVIGGCTFYDRSTFDQQQLFRLSGGIRPDIVLCSGWVDKTYMKICRHYFGKIPTVVTLDNHWRNDFKQHIWSLLSPVYLRRVFSHAWVPGQPQHQYAKRLCFPEKNIHTGFYSADTDYFSGRYRTFLPEKQQNYPKRFLYVGRYIEAKGIHTLWNAFVSAVEKTQSDWELWCLGTGTLFDQKREHSSIRHFGFVQPADMARYLQQTGVFVLPSTFEPWGVVVHEMAASGMPLLCSDKVGAATQFLSPGKNGFTFPSGNETALEQILIRMMQMDTKQLLQMGEASHQLGHQITPKTWSQTILDMVTSQ